MTEEISRRPTNIFAISIKAKNEMLKHNLLLLSSDGREEGEKRRKRSLNNAIKEQIF